MAGGYRHSQGIAIPLYLPEETQCSCYLELLDKLQKWIFKTDGPSLAASLESLAHCWNVTSLSVLSVLFWWIFFRTGSPGSTSFFLWEVYFLFW